MKELTELCVSRELAERMRAFGFEQKTLFYWLWTSLSGFELFHRDNPVVDLELFPENYISAPTSAEIDFFVNSGGGNDIYIYIYFSLFANGYKASFWDDFGNATDILADTEAEAIGLMWCYLKEKGLL